MPPTTVTRITLILVTTQVILQVSVQLPQGFLSTGVSHLPTPTVTSWNHCGPAGEVIAVVQLLNHVPLFATPWTAALQAPLSSAGSQTLFRFMSIESVMLPNHLILCHQG